MKISITKIKSSLFLALFIFSLGAQARLVGKIHKVKGMAFMTHDGRTITLKEGMDIHQSAQIIVSDQAQVTLGDFNERRFHLTGGSSLILNQNEATLLAGSVWSQATAFSKNFVLSSANMHMQSFKGEYVATYSPDTKKTQLTVISGEVNAASPKKPELRYGILAGHFTTAHEDHDEGYPRSPTQLGFSSLTNTLKMFPGVEAIDTSVASAQKKADIGREIASIGAEDSAKPEVLHIKSSFVERKIASVDTAQKYYLKKTKRAQSARHGQGAKVRVIGMHPAGSIPQAVKAPKRQVASVVQAPAAPVKGEANLSEFLNSYQYHQGKQHKHTPEVQRLIDDLKSY